jgi:hypothetical protein
MGRLKLFHPANHTSATGELHPRHHDSPSRKHPCELNIALSAGQQTHLAPTADRIKQSLPPESFSVESRPIAANWMLSSRPIPEPATEPYRQESKPHPPFRDRGISSFFKMLEETGFDLRPPGPYGPSTLSKRKLDPELDPAPKTGHPANPQNQPFPATSSNRGDRIRTCDRPAPSRVRYQTAPLPVALQSGRRELNPPLKLGRLPCSHNTSPASRRNHTGRTQRSRCNTNPPNLPPPPDAPPWAPPPRHPSAPAAAKARTSCRAPRPA